MNQRIVYILAAYLASCASGEIARELQAPTNPPTILEVWDAVYGYEDENGNIVTVSELPADIAEEQANAPVGDVEEEAIVAAPTAPPTFDTLEDMEHVFGYEDENGNIIEVDQLPEDIREEQANTPVYPEDYEAPTEESPVEDEELADEFDTSSTADNGLATQDQQSPNDVSEKQEIEVALIAFLAGGAFVILIGATFLFCNRRRDTIEDDSESSFVGGKGKRAEAIEMTETSETGSSENSESDGPVLMARRVIESGSTDPNLSDAIAEMRRKEQQALKDLYLQEGQFVI